MKNLLIFLFTLDFLGVIIPLIALLKYLYSHRQKNGPTQEMRRILAIVSGAKLLFFITEVALTLSALLRNEVIGWAIVFTFLFASTVLAIANWYAWIKIVRIKL